MHLEGAVWSRAAHVNFMQRLDGAGESIYPFTYLSFYVGEGMWHHPKADS